MNRLCLLLILLACSSMTVCAKHSNMASEYLESQFDWGLYVDAQKLDHYLNYSGSRLHPLTHVEVYFRQFPKGTSALHEEFWYHEGKPLGLRRRTKLKVVDGTIGAVVIGALPNPDSVRAAANVVLRIVTEARVNHVTVSTVIIPDDSYGEIAQELQRYNFGKKMTSEEGQQFSITLHSASGDRDEQYFYQRR
jgi:hypothetical protein